MLKIMRKMQDYKVHKICVEQNWWNRGTTAEYTELFKMIEQFNKFKTEKKQIEVLEKMAELTVLNTDFSASYADGYTFDDMAQNVAYYFVNDACYTIINPL